MNRKEKLDIDLLKFLTYLSNETDNKYIWRESCGLIKEIKSINNIESKNISESIVCNCKIPKTTLEQINYCINCKKIVEYAR
jgi:hypothetical protein